MRAQLDLDEHFFANTIYPTILEHTFHHHQMYHEKKQSLAILKII